MAKSRKKEIAVNFEDLHYLELVNIVRSRGRVNKEKTNNAYNEIEKRIRPKVKYIVSQFYIPGCNKDDIYQEALYALRFKAIPDYNKDRGNHGPYPFDNFAILCIRRHLMTKLKSSFQYKKRALNTSVSLDQDRNESSDEVLSLSDIIPRTNGTILDFLEDKEYYKRLFHGLFQKLSNFEKKVFVLYTKKYTYDQMTDLINENYKKNEQKKKIDVKSVDNALSRIKQKAKEVYDKMEE